MSAILDLLKRTATRAGIGAAAGAGTGEAVSGGDTTAGVTGSIFGGLAGLTGHGLYESGGALARMARLMGNPENRARRMLVKSMAADQISPDDMKSLITSGRDSTPLFAHGEGNVLHKMEQAALVPDSNATNMAHNFYKGYLDDQDVRVGQEVQAGTGVAMGDATKTVDALQTLKQAESGPAYDKAYQMEGIHDDVLDGLLDRAQKAGSFGHMEEIANADPDWTYGMPKQVTLDDGSKIYRLDTRHLDLIKRGIDQSISEHTDEFGKTDETGRAYTKLKKAILARADEINPDYATARKTFSDRQTSQNAVNDGVKFLGSKVENMDNYVSKFNDLDPGDKQFFLVGVAQGMKNKMMSGVQGQDEVKKFFSQKGMREKLRAVFPDDASFTKFAAAMDEEMKVARSKNTVMGNSATARRLAGATESAKDDLDLLGDFGHAVTGNFFPMIKSVITSMKGAGMGKKTAESLMKMLLSTDKNGNLQLMDELKTLQGRMRAARVAGSGAGHVVAGGMGALAGASEGEDIPQQ